MNIDSIKFWVRSLLNPIFQVKCNFEDLCHRNANSTAFKRFARRQRIIASLIKKHESDTILFRDLTNAVLPENCIPRSTKIVFDICEHPNLLERRDLNLKLDKKTISQANYLIRRFLNSASGISCNSKIISNEFKRIFSAPTTVTLPSLGKKWTKTAIIRKKIGIKSNEFLLIIPNGEFRVLESTVRLIAHLPQNFHFLFSGNTYNQVSEAMVLSIGNELGMNGRLHFSSFIPETFLRSKYLIGADAILYMTDQTLEIFAHKFRSELLDAANCQLPIVAIRTPISEEFVESIEAGVLFDRPKPELLLDSLHRLMQMPDDKRKQLGKSLSKLFLNGDYGNIDDYMKKAIDRPSKHRGDLNNKRSILIIESDNHENDDRSIEMCRWMNNLGYKVTVLCHQLPKRSVYKYLSDVNFLEINGLGRIRKPKMKR